MANVNPIFTTNVTVDPVTPQDIVAPGSYDRFKIIGLSAGSLFYSGGAGQAEIESGAAR